MKSKQKRTIASTHLGVRERRVEIQTFLRACRSYPARFAGNPQISFEEHLFNISAGHDARAREQRSGRNQENLSD